MPTEEFPDLTVSAETLFLLFLFLGIGWGHGFDK